MKRFMSKSWLGVVALLVSTALLMLGSQLSQAQDAKAPVKKEDPAKPEVTKPKQRAKPRGQLPNFYKEVVSKEQTEAIYKVQKAYTDKIDALTAQLKELMAQRDADVEKILTPEQIKKVKELQVAGKEKAQALLAKKAADKVEAAKTDASKADAAKPAASAKPGEAPKKATP